MDVRWISDHACVLPSGSPLQCPLHFHSRSPLITSTQLSLAAPFHEHDGRTPGVCLGPPASCESSPRVPTETLALRSTAGGCTHGVGAQADVLLNVSFGSFDAQNVAIRRYRFGTCPSRVDLVPGRTFSTARHGIVLASLARQHPPEDHRGPTRDHFFSLLAIESSVSDPTT
jgi:hypothetical protein